MDLFDDWLKPLSEVAVRFALAYMFFEIGLNIAR